MQIGTVKIDGRLVLAPMAGVTDLAFRRICREHGAALTVTEMVSTKALCYQDRKTPRLLELAPDEHPAAAQIFGHEPETMAEGARIALVADADGVNAASIVAAINNGGSSVTLSADKIDLNGITTVADTLHIGSENSLERKYLIFHKSGAVISATRGDVPELKLSAGKIDLCGTLYHNGQPLDL